MKSGEVVRAVQGVVQERVVVEVEKEEVEEVEEEWRSHTKMQDQVWRGGNMRVETSL